MSGAASGPARSGPIPWRCPSEHPRRSSRARAFWVAAALACAVSSASAASAQYRLHYSDQWARIHPASYVATTTSVATALFVENLYRPGTPLLRGSVPGDDPFREALRADQYEAREIAATISNVLLGALLGWPVVDGLGVAGLGDLNPDVAWQLTMIHAEVVAADYFLSTIVKALVRRERPGHAHCTEAELARSSGRCSDRGRSRSFYSGHASAAFASAGVVCMTHAYVPLYGSRSDDAIACGAAMATATLTSLLRLVADRHYLTDVLAGTAVGLALGLLMPYFLHFGLDLSGADSAPAVAPLASAPMIVSFGGTL